jgi:hypothetical protein
LIPHADKHTTPSSLSLELFVAFSPSSPRTSNTKAFIATEKVSKSAEFLFHHLLGLYNVQLQITVAMELELKSSFMAS